MAAEAGGVGGEAEVLPHAGDGVAEELDVAARVVAADAVVLDSEAADDDEERFRGDRPTVPEPDRRDLDEILAVRETWGR